MILNKKFIPLFNDDSRYFIITGGRGSAKSFAVSTFATLLSFEKGQKILYSRQTMTSAEKSIIPEFKEKIELLGLENMFQIRKTDIKNLAMGGEIIFKGTRTSSLDQTAALKSYQGVTTWIFEEAEELTDEDTFDRVNYSFRKAGIQNRIILILNPTTREHWIYKRFFEQPKVKDGSNTNHDGITYIHTSYLDNINNLDKDYLKEFERVRKLDPKKYEHIIMGGWVDRYEGTVFNNWKRGDFNPHNLPSTFGQDYGYSVDPTTLIEIARDDERKKLWVKEHLYRTHMSLDDIAKVNKEVCVFKLIVAESADPRMIDGLKSKGCNIKAVKKSAGSIEAGISFMQDYEIIVDEGSENIIKELNHYSYEDKGKKLYIDRYNHAIDAIRYNILHTRGRPHYGVYDIR